MSNFCILRVCKHKTALSVWGVARHHNREIDCVTATGDATKNKAFGHTSSHAASTRIKERLSEIESISRMHKVRKNQCVALEYMITASPEAMCDNKKAIAYLNAAKKWIEEKHGKNNVVATYFHADETTPHLHIVVVPVHSETQKLSAGYYVDGREKMIALQTNFHAEVAAQFGLDRGIEKSNAKHIPIKNFWKKVNSKVEKPSLIDYAKASIGLKVPAIDAVNAKADATNVLMSMQSATKKRANAVRTIEVQQAATAREQKSNASVSDLKAENTKLRAELAQYKTDKTPALQALGIDNFGLS
jgi:hypothetical protein